MNATDKNIFFNAPSMDRLFKHYDEIVEITFQAYPHASRHEVLTNMVRDLVDVFRESPTQTVTTRIVSLLCYEAGMEGNKLFEKIAKTHSTVDHALTLNLGWDALTPAAQMQELADFSNYLHRLYLQYNNNISYTRFNFDLCVGLANEYEDARIKNLSFSNNILNALQLVCEVAEDYGMPPQTIRLCDVVDSSHKKLDYKKNRFLIQEIVRVTSDEVFQDDYCTWPFY